MKKWMFICTGNTCRSPMAEKLAQVLILEAGLGIQVSSCGLAARSGEAAHPFAIQAMAVRGLDLKQHRAKNLEISQETQATVFLTMTRQHKQYMCDRYPELRGQVHTLLEYAGMEGDVSDPYGGPPAAYEACVQVMLPAIKAIVMKSMEDKT